MNISLDYDDTYTRSPKCWDKMLKLFRKEGHKVYLVSWRHEHEMEEVYTALKGKVDGFYATGRKAKQTFMFKQGICIDVFVDDFPAAIIFDKPEF